MSDPFDPEAWPRSSGASSPRKDGEDDFTTSEEDGFNPFSATGTDEDYDASVFGAPADQFGEETTYGAEDQEEEDNFQGSYGDDDDDEDDDPWNGVAANYGDDDDDFAFDQPAAVVPATAAAGSAATARGGKGESDYRDEFDEYDDFDDYDDEEGDTYQDDFDSDFDDREPSEGGNLKRILVIVGAILIVGLAGGGILFAFGGGGGDNNVATPTTVTTASDNTPTSQQTTGTTAKGGDSTTQAVAPKDVTDTLTNALAAWGRFAVNGNLEEVKPYFVEDSNQYNRFKLDAAAIASQPPGGAPINVAMPNPQTFHDEGNDNEWTVRGTATWARPGEQTQNFNWEIELVRASDRQPWLIQSVRQF